MSPPDMLGEVETPIGCVDLARARAGDGVTHSFIPLEARGRAPWTG